MKKTTEIAFILDRSGSMSCMVESAIAGFNHLVRDQQSAPGEARLTLVLFDDEYLVPVDSRPLDEVPELTTATYVPRGCTALLDAIGRTIDSLGKRLAAISEAMRPGKVIVAILTDGLENASTDYDGPRIAKMIRHQTNHYAWEFLFLGADQDAIATAAALNIPEQNAVTFRLNAKGVSDAAGAVSDRVRFAREAPADFSKAPSLKEVYDVRDKADTP